jgi:hypothetical protein
VEQVFRRRQVKTHTRLAREELTEGFGHLRMAAAHAADGAAGALAPRVDAARKAVKPGITKASGAVVGMALMAPAGAKRLARRGKKKETGMAGKRWPMMIGGLLATGVAVGAASAMLRRRRSRNAWDEYGSTRTSSDTGAMLKSAESTMDAGVDKAARKAEAVRERGSDMIGSTGSSSGAPIGVDKTADRTMADSASKNSRP